MALPTPKLTAKLSCGGNHIQASREPSDRVHRSHSNRDKRGSLSTHQCARSVCIGESNHSLVRHLPAPQDCAGLSDQHEGRVVSQGNCDGDVYGAVDQQTRDCDRSGAGGERGREQP